MLKTITSSLMLLSFSVFSQSADLYCDGKKIDYAKVKERDNAYFNYLYEADCGVEAEYICFKGDIDQARIMYNRLNKQLYVNVNAPILKYYKAKQTSADDLEAFFKLNEDVSGTKEKTIVSRCK